MGMAFLLLGGITVLVAFASEYASPPPPCPRPPAPFDPHPLPLSSFAFLAPVQKSQTCWGAIHLHGHGLPSSWRHHRSCCGLCFRVWPLSPLSSMLSACFSHVTICFLQTGLSRASLALPCASWNKGSCNKGCCNREPYVDNASLVQCLEAKLVFSYSNLAATAMS